MNKAKAIYNTVNNSIFSTVGSAVYIAVRCAVYNTVFSVVNNSTVNRSVRMAIDNVLNKTHPAHITTEVNRVLSVLSE